MKARKLVLLLVFIAIFVEVGAPKGRGKDKPTPGQRGRKQRGPGHRGPPDLEARKAGRSSRGPAAKRRDKSRVDDYFSSIVSRVDDTIVINLGDGWIDLFGGGNNNANQQRQTPPAPQVASTVSDETPVPHSGEWIRLRAVKGFMNAGIVEAYRAGRWGLVCDDGWDTKDANVACRQLGFKQGAQAWPGKAYYGIPPGRWTSNDIIMDDVECDGTETSLQRCQYEDRHDCTVSEAASVACRPNKGCADGWIGGGDSCYRFFGGASNIKAAGAMCLSLNASLVSVDTMQENHFLSNVITLTASKEEHVWYTSGRLSKKMWRWSRNVARAPKRSKSGGSRRRSRGRKGKSKGKGKGKKRPKAGKGRKTRSAGRRMRTMRASVEVSRWFPGWGRSEEGREPSKKKGHTCLVLTDQFPLPNGTVVGVDYYFWKASRCRQKGKTISFVCEMPASPQPKECYTGIGEDYRGHVARTDFGTPCISWAQTAVNHVSHPGKGLGDHNYCRNPDEDQRPWCWVARGKFGFCPIPLCSATTPSPATTTTAAPDTPNCPADEFFCKTGNQCIPGPFQCDGEEDCEDGEDELNCEYSSENFEEYPNRIPENPFKNLTYANLPLETCASYCLKNTYFTCMSFVYNEDERQCQLLDAAEDAQIHLLPSDRHDYYLLRSEAANCTGKFRCDNERCIPAEKMCNGHDDCGDLSDELRCATPPPPMTVRLVDGDENSGRVEVHYMNEWGTVCDDQWDIKDASVVCRMLGYSGAVRASVMGEFGSGRGNILLDEVECSGNEQSLHDCLAAPWKKHDCQSFEAAGVVCQVAKSCADDQFACENKTLPLCVEADKVCDGAPTCPDASDEADCKLKVELVNGTSRHEGRVELIRNGLRGTVCDDEWGEEEAHVVCKMLGYRYGGEALSGSHFGRGSGLIWLDDVSCDVTSRSLAACAHKGWTVNDCSHLEDAGVRCFTSRPTVTTSTTTTTTTPPSETVRVYLVNGSSPNQGRVELEVGSYRGTICDDSFDNRDARVICRMAGYSDGGRAVVNAGYGAGSSRLAILLDEVDCTGQESSVLDCGHLQPLGTHNCRHGEDAGVFCVVPGSTQLPDTDEEGRVLTTPTPTSTREAPTSFLGVAQCGLRPLERLHRHKRQVAGLNVTAPQEVEMPRFLKIVGGDLAQHGMFPWQVGIQKIYNIYPDGDMLVGHWCGGTILNRHWVISAAHCFKKLAKSRLLLKVGDHGQKVLDEGEQKFQVEELIMHRNYDQETHDYDIALLKVKSDDGQGIKFNDYVQPACLPTSATSYIAGIKCYISGWGGTGNGDKYPNNLRSAKVPLLGFNVCNYLYKGDLSRRMLCAGYLEGGVDTCQGDSGGPLVCDVDGIYTLLGVTSWGFGCAQPNAPGVYTRTLEFLTWIENSIRRHESSQ